MTPKFTIYRNGLVHVMSEECSTFWVQRRSGEQVLVIVDAADFDRVAALTWNLDARGYVVRARKGEVGVKLHRFILGLGHDDPGVDHINGLKTDNRRANLRVANQQVNSLNLSETNGRGASRYRGVTYHAGTGKWRATQRIAGVSHALGLHHTEEEAVAALRRFREQKGIPSREQA